MRKKRADVLNKHGHVLRALKVGDHVKIYQPPSHAEAVRRRRKAKHFNQFRGPLRIVEKPSNTTFKLDRDGKIFRRNIANIRRWNGPLPQAGTQQMTTGDMEADIKAGEMVIARENSDVKVLDVAKVIDVDWIERSVFETGKEIGP